MADKVKVVWGAVLIAPISFNNFYVGPFELETEVRPGETVESAIDRGYAQLDAFARKSYPSKLHAWQEMYKGSQVKTRG